MLEKGAAHRFFSENGGHDSAFYLPFFQDAFRYVRPGMYQSDEGVETALRGRLIRNGTKLRGEITAEESISGYFLQIPASTYTKNPEPALNVPIRIDVLKGEETLAVFTNREVWLDPASLTAELEADLGEWIGKEQELTVRLTATVFDRTILLDSMEIKAE